MSQEKQPRIAVIGSTNVDLVTYLKRMPRPGETIAADSFEMGQGGKGANQAVAAAKLGAEVIMLGAVGDDAFAGPTLTHLSGYGVDVSHIRRALGVSSGVASILVDPSGENVIMIVAGANGTMSAADIEAASADLMTCDLILLQLEIPLDAVYAALEFGRKHGVKTLLNPAPANPDLDPDHVRLASFLVPNETELAILTGLSVDSESQIATAAKSLIDKGVGTVIVTMGSRGALLVEAEAVTRIEPVKVTPVDTVGAGDAFVGAFARYYAAGVGVVPALDMAAAYAADSVTRRGTQKAYATEQEFDRIRTVQGRG
ncbi:MAG: ribokinase [Ancalomicrobiaceae bacterium]|nr:ribokinase [Ancalomicrobiaceae bacterium]